MSYKEDGVLTQEDLDLPPKKRLEKGPIVIIECVEHIPCNPCVDACPFDAISMRTITDLPEVEYEVCTGCGTCITICPGLAIFVVDLSGDTARVTLPYEFLPVPEEGDTVKALNRRGEAVGDATVVNVREGENKTYAVTIEVEKDLGMIVRNIEVVE